MRHIHFTPEGSLLPRGIESSLTIPGMSCVQAYAEVQKFNGKVGHRSIKFPKKEYVFQYKDQFGAHCALKRFVGFNAVVENNLLLNGLLAGHIQKELEAQSYYPVTGRFVLKGLTKALWGPQDELEDVVLIVAPVSNAAIFKS